MNEKNQARSRPITCSRPVLLPVLAELTPRGDGSFILKPKVPDDAGHSWLPVADSARFLEVRRSAIYPWLGQLLVYRRPLIAKYLIRLDSLQRLRNATLDPEFWSCAALQKPLRNWVSEQMHSLILMATSAP